jgi:hypothetical protein
MWIIQHIKLNTEQDAIEWEACDMFKPITDERVATSLAIVATETFGLHRIEWEE